MKRIAGLLLAAGLVLACDGSDGTVQSVTEPSSSPVISNLKILGFTRVDANSGEMGVTFDFTDPDSDVQRVLWKFPDGEGVNGLQQAAGRSSGSVNILQSVHLPDPAAREIEFTVQVADSRGNLSNVLAGRTAVPPVP